MNNKPIRSVIKRTIAFHLFNEKVLLFVLAGLSLAFTLFYTFAHNAAHASANDVAAAPPMSSSEKPISMNSSADTGEAASAVSDVVSKALAFKSLLTSSQQAMLEQSYTSYLARRWSNLPCGSSCRNGIQFSTLTATQLNAALAVIQAAAGTAANEGYDEFNQIRAADDYLNANGGGSGYGSGIYFIAFLNTPTTTGPWMLQFGGHHYGANIAFNSGHVVGATPQFEGVEPSTSFTINGATYAPLAQEHDAMANMLASLTSDQLAAAKLSQTFSDVTMSPGESNGGNGTFPTTKVGVAVSTLSDAQKQLVLEAIKPWVRDADDTVAANLLAIYQSELNGTYIAYTGNGTSGNPSSFLNANTNYVRIDGPSVWIEFICQTGVVFRNQIHYHSVWRDHTRDYGADLSLTTALDTNPIDNPTFFVTQHYSDFLNRQPDSAGLSFWTNQITSCGSDTNCVDVKRQNVSAAFFLSREFQETGFFVIRIQRAAFGKMSSNASTRITFSQFLTDAKTVGNGFIDGQSGADAVLDANKTAYAQSIISSSPFAAQYPTSMTAAQFVDALFSTAGVTPMASERQAAITAFGSGDAAGRAAALRSVAESASVKSAEFNAGFVLMQYFGYLRRNPTDAPDTSDAGYQFWLSKLNAFGGDYIKSEMVRSFIVSSEYRKRFGSA